jgi:hypothetical protein
MTEMAGSLGCVYSHCVDDDSYDLTPEGTYYAWSVRVPRDKLLHRHPVQKRGEECPVTGAESHPS